MTQFRFKVAKTKTAHPVYLHTLHAFNHALDMITMFQPCFITQAGSCQNKMTRLEPLCDQLGGNFTKIGIPIRNIVDVR